MGKATAHTRRGFGRFEDTDGVLARGADEGGPLDAKALAIDLAAIEAADLAIGSGDSGHLSLSVAREGPDEDDTDADDADRVEHAAWHDPIPALLGAYDPIGDREAAFTAAVEAEAEESGLAPLAVHAIGGADWPDQRAAEVAHCKSIGWLMEKANTFEVMGGWADRGELWILMAGAIRRLARDVAFCGGIAALRNSPLGNPYLRRVGIGDAPAVRGEDAGPKGGEG